MDDSESDEKESSFYTRKDRTKRKDDVEMDDSESGSKTSSVDQLII